MFPEGREFDNTKKMMLTKEGHSSDQGWNTRDLQKKKNNKKTKQKKKYFLWL